MSQSEQATGDGSPAEPISFGQRWLPHPLLTFVLVLLWMALLNEYSHGGLLVALVLGISIPIYTSNFWPGRPVIRSPLKAVAFGLIVCWDILVANIVVASTILFRPNRALRTHWLVVPLDLTSPEAIATLSATITLTPGTVTSDLSADGRSLLVHCLDVEDPAAEVAKIKQRYESRIKAFFP